MRATGGDTNTFERDECGATSHCSSRKGGREREREILALSFLPFEGVAVRVIRKVDTVVPH